MTTLAPATNITVGTSPVPRSSPTDTGVAHIVGMSTQGPAGRLLTNDDAIYNQAQWIARYGGGSLANARLSYSVDYDWIERFFARGGNKLFYSRAVGPAAAKATLNLTGTGTTLIVTADEHGSYFNQFKIAVITSGSGRKIQLLQNDGTTLIEQTAELLTQAAFNNVKLGVSANVPVTITLGGGSGLPSNLSATGLGTTTAGTDDHASITQTQVDAALTYLTIDNGPGQVASPNWQTDAAHDSLDAHAAGYNRFAVPDPTDTTSKSTFVSAGSHRKGTANGSYGALYAPWINYPPLAGGGVTPRAVPPSAVVCAAFATTDPTDTPSQSPAGQWGTDPSAIGVRATFAFLPKGASEADDLANAAVNLIAVKNGVVTINDILTGAADDDEFQQIGVARWRMQTVALIGAQAGSEQFARINKNTLAAWETAANGILLRQYTNGQLFGDLDDDRPETAFNVDADTPNTPTTINAGQMNMNIAARPVKGGRILNISITAVPITAAVA